MTMPGAVVATAFCAVAVTPASAFITNPLPATGVPALRAHAAGSAEPQAGHQASFGAAACAVSGLAAAAGLLSLKRRRSSVPVRVMDKPVLVVDWKVEPKTPVPGSEKALGQMVGADVETGGVPWDPLGFSKLYDRNFDFNMVMTYPHAQWLRESEIKHGRICMLAFVGMVVQSFVQITPPYPAEPDWTKALAECYTDKLATLGLVQISVFTMIVEGKFYPGDAWIGQLDREAGDLGFDPLKLSRKAGFEMKSMQLKEIKNGRLAMIGVASLAAAHAIPGSVPLIGASAVCREAAKVGVAGQFCGASRPTGLQAQDAPTKTAAKYTTQVILPSLTWLKTGLKASDLAPKELKAKTIGGNDVLIGKDESGKLFCVGNLCPHIGTPMSEGADVIGDVIVCPLHGSSFKVTTGELIDWCPSPPIIGPLTGLVIEKKNLLVFNLREGGLFGGGEIEVLVDTNAKRAYEANYWKGLLDAQGKDDGTYY